MRFCSECSNKTMFNKYNNLVNENEEFKAKLNLLKRQAASEFGQMLPYFEE